MVTEVGIVVLSGEENIDWEITNMRELSGGARDSLHPDLGGGCTAVYILIFIKLYTKMCTFYTHAMHVTPQFFR